MRDTLKQQKLAAKRRAQRVYEFYLARGFSSLEAQQMQIDHFAGRKVSSATNAPIQQRESVLAEEHATGADAS